MKPGLSIVLLAFLFQSAFAQMFVPFSELAAAPTFEDVDASSIAFADVDNDGDQDLFLTGKDLLGRGGKYFSKLYLNDGAGNFIESAQAFEGVDESSIAFADMNNDGDLDLAYAGLNNDDVQKTYIYTNDGTGKFTQWGSLVPVGVEDAAIAFSDVDKDGLQDLLITGFTGPAASGTRVAKLYLNKYAYPALSFQEADATNAPFEPIRGGAVAFADVNGDGHSDLLLTGNGNSSPQIAKLYTNNGAGVFTEKSTSFEAVDNSAIALADVDKDGDQDVLLTGQNAAKETIAKLYLNNGQGVFTEKTGTPFPGVRNGSVAFADVDGDGDPDVLIKGANLNAGTTTFISKLYLNDGQGVFTEKTETPFVGVNNSAVAFSDVDGDGDQDVLVSGRSAVGNFTELFLNDGKGNFAEVKGNTLVGFKSGKFGIANLVKEDNRHYQDVLYLGQAPDGTLVADLYANDGKAFFGAKSVSSAITGITEPVTIRFADVDQDFDQDVLVTGWDAGGKVSAKLYANDGNWNFSLMSQNNLANLTSGIFWDTDKDRDQDLLLWGYDFDNDKQTIKLYANDGTGAFSEVPDTPFEALDGGDATFVDVDWDGNWDLLMTGGTSSGSIVAKLYRNEGNNSFSEVTETPFEGTVRGSVHYLDVERDGDRDVLITGMNSASAPTANLYINQGSGTFVKKTDVPFEGILDGQAVIADIDQDGDQDILLYGTTALGSNMKVAKLYLNDGWGYFNEMPDLPFERTEGGQAAIAELNYEGAPEVLITGKNSAGEFVTKLYINRLFDPGFASGGSIPRNYGGHFFYDMEASAYLDVGKGMIALGDVNKDGYEDLVLAGRPGYTTDEATKLYLNNGRGAFGEVSGAPFRGTMGGTAILADVDKDSDLDLFTVGTQGPMLYLNDGSGTFAEGTQLFGLGVGGRAVMADVDKDGAPEILFSGIYNGIDALVYCKNDGAGNFTREALSVTKLNGLFYDFADVDNDGDQDLLYGGNTFWSKENPTITFITKLYLNDGQGAFTEDTRSEFEGLYQGEIEFGDVDNDGDQDVVIMGKRSIPSRFNTAGNIAMLYLNDGTGLFTLSEHQPFPSGVDGPIVFRDADGDGDQDILNRGRLLLNDGAGKFRSSRASDHRWGGPHQFCDADKDGDLDIVINGGDRTSAKILINNQIPGHFAIVENAPFPKLSFATIAISDVNEDQHPDVLMTGLDNRYAQKTHGERGKPTTMLYINNGNGGYQEKPGLPFEQVFKGATTFADVNGDQRPDLLLTGVTADSETPVAKLYLNSGGGAFAELPNPNLSGIVGGAATFLDIDADGDQDLVLEGADKWGSGAQQVRRVYSNDGSGRFSLIANPSTFLGKEAGKGVFGDVTGDGKEDFLRIGKNPKLFRNDGGGNFSDLQSATFQDLGEIKSAAFADVDGDGDQDALISIHSGTEPEEGTAKLYLNDGQGAFTEVAETPFAGISAQRLEFGDYNGDGDTDLVIFGSRKVPGPNDYAEKTSVYSFPHGPKFSSFIRLYFNDGNGSFTEDGGTPLISMPESAAAFTDLDNDGDTDILQVGRTPNNLGGLTDRRAILYLNNTIKP